MANAMQKVFDPLDLTNKVLKGFGIGHHKKDAAAPVVAAAPAPATEDDTVKKKRRSMLDQRRRSEDTILADPVESETLG